MKQTKLSLVLHVKVLWFRSEYYLLDRLVCVKHGTIITPKRYDSRFRSHDSRTVTTRGRYRHTANFELSTRNTNVDTSNVLNVQSSWNFRENRSHETRETCSRRNELLTALRLETEKRDRKTQRPRRCTSTVTTCLRFSGRVWRTNRCPTTTVRTLEFSSRPDANKHAHAIPCAGVTCMRYSETRFLCFIAMNKHEGKTLPLDFRFDARPNRPSERNKSSSVGSLEESCYCIGRVPRTEQYT